MFSYAVKVIGLIALVSADELAQSRVYGGQHVAPVHVDPYTGFETATNTGEYPYIVSLEMDGRHFCGGALIKADVVLTAAHCVSGTEGFMLKVRAGIVVRGETKAGAQVQNVKFFVYHEHYSHKNMNNDIALMKLQGKFKLSKFVGLATLPTQKKSFTGRTALIIGWGEDEFTKPSTVLKKADLEIISNAECSKLMLKPIPDIMLCGYDKAHQLRSPCSGDSGGPLVIGKNTVVGVSSWVVAEGKNLEYCSTKLPSVFSNVAVFTPWISAQLAKRF